MGMRAIVALLLALCAPVLCAQPVNDDWSTRDIVGALPFTDIESDVAFASIGLDPPLQCRIGAAITGGNTLWYGYTTASATQYVDISTATSDYDTIVAVFTGQPGSFVFVTGACNDNGIPSVMQSRIAGLRLQPNTAYSIVVARHTGAETAATLSLSIAAAPVYSVTTTADTSPDGCAVGACTLREAISASNAVPGAIVLSAGTYVLSIPSSIDDLNTAGDLDVRGPAGIYGAGAATTIVDGSDLDRVLHVDPDFANRTTLIVADVTLRNGTTNLDGGGVDVTGSGNFVAFERVRILDNVATFVGGGMRSPSRTQLLASTVAGNRAGVGGGLASASGSDVGMEIRDSTISDNTSVNNSGSGGGGINSISGLRIDNSTISGNRASSHGGGIHMESSGTLRLRSVTVAGNTADFAPDGGGSGGGLRLDTNNTVELRNTLVAGNTDNTAGAAPDCSKGGAGPLVSSYSLLQVASGGCVLAGEGDVSGVDPALQALADNGGPTLTHAIGSGPALDGGDPAGCFDFRAVALTFDQRGSPFVRDDNDTCDKGAYEFAVLLFGNGFE